MTTPALIALSGRLGSGKSTLARELAAHLGWPLASFGGYLRGVAAGRGLPDTREALQELGASLLEREGARSFCEAVLRSAGWRPGRPAIVEGVRHVAVASALRELAAPLPSLLVYLQSSEEVRRGRLDRRGENELGRLPAIESHSTEADVGEKLGMLADLLVDSEQEVLAVVHEVVATLSREG